MNINDLNISETLSNAKKLLEEEKHISPALKAVVELLLTIVTLFAGRLSLSSRNSNKPPASDPNRQKEKNGKGKNKPGGQPGRQGVTL